LVRVADCEKPLGEGLRGIGLPLRGFLQSFRGSTWVQQKAGIYHPGFCLLGKELGWEIRNISAILLGNVG
jgi:hypothetical protein